MELDLEDIESIRAFLKKNFDGPLVVEALKARLRSHLEDPMVDPLSRQVWPGYLKLPEILKEPFSLLDAGCMSGFLYHHLKKYFKDFTYVGVDKWPEALEVGREFAPGVRFYEGDFLKEGPDEDYDYIVLSNIAFSTIQANQAISNLAPRARRSLIVINPNGQIIAVSALKSSRNTADNRETAGNLPA